MSGVCVHILAMFYASFVSVCRVIMQTRIAEYIRQKNVEENFESAMEFNPEVFAQVTMLYVNMDVGTSRSPSTLQCLTNISAVSSSYSGALW